SGRGRAGFRWCATGAQSDARTSADYRVAEAVFPLARRSFYARASAPPGKPRDAALNVAANAPLLLVLLVLLLIVAFSSGTEVAMLSVNRYRIRHRAQSGHGTARVLERLLQKPDDWLRATL